MRKQMLFARLLGYEETVVEDVVFERGRLVLEARPAARAASRCGVCGRRSAGYDQGSGRREWRALDVYAQVCVIRAAAPRVRCREHGVVVARVPWAAHGARHTYGFAQEVAWSACEMSKTAITRKLRVGWRTVGVLCAEVVARRDEGRDRLARLRRIGIDEISFRKGQRYLTVVVDHEQSRVVWIAEGRDASVVDRFFAALGTQRTAALTHVSVDMGSWLHVSLRRHLAASTRVCIDPFHVVALAGEALDVVRRELWNQARQAGDEDGARLLKGSRFAVWKRPERLTDAQLTRLAALELLNAPLYAAYLLKEDLRSLFQLTDSSPDELAGRFDGWITSAAAATSPAAFRKVAQTLSRFRNQILDAIAERVSNARIEAVNTTIRLIVRRAYGFHSAEAMIALVLLKLGGDKIELSATG